MSMDKYLSIFSRQMTAIVYIAILGNAGPSSCQYRLNAARYIQKLPRTNIPPVKLVQARLVSSALYGTLVTLARFQKQTNKRLMKVLKWSV